MHEVFSKIIEKLEEENSRLKRLRNNCIALSDSEVSAIENKAYNFSIEIVKQEAEQYNNGWIPCSERLPEEPEITGDVEEDISNGKLNEYIGMIYGAEKPIILYYAGERCWYDEVSQDYYPVRAWQPLPEPYQPKGE